MLSSIIMQIKTIYTKLNKLENNKMQKKKYKNMAFHDIVKLLIFLENNPPTSYKQRMILTALGSPSQLIFLWQRPPLGSGYESTRVKF